LQSQKLNEYETPHRNRVPDPENVGGIGKEEQHPPRISTLHIYWAQRPIASSRTATLAALLPDDPARRDQLLRVFEDLGAWEAVAKAERDACYLIQQARDALLRYAYPNHPCAC
jgi:hypothetical protein